MKSLSISCARLRFHTRQHLVKRHLVSKSGSQTSSKAVYLPDKIKVKGLAGDPLLEPVKQLRVKVMETKGHDLIQSFFRNNQVTVTHENTKQLLMDPKNLQTHKKNFQGSNLGRGPPSQMNKGNKNENAS